MSESNYILIPLNGKYAQGRSVKVSVGFAYLATQSSWCVNDNGYAIRRWRGKMQYLHHAILAGQKGLCVDHINRNKLDNRTENLRLTTWSENLRNSDAHKDSQSGAKNIHVVKGGMFAVAFRIKSKYIWVGCFKTLKEAIKKRDEARRVHGYHL